MAGLLIPQDVIATMIVSDHTGEPISETTLKNHFQKQLTDGAAKLRVRHGMALFKNVEAGNVTAQIWWDKTRNRVNERIGLTPLLPASALPETETPGADKSKLEIARRIAFALYSLEREQRAAKETQPAQPAAQQLQTKPQPS